MDARRIPFAAALAAAGLFLALGIAAGVVMGARLVASGTEAPKRVTITKATEPGSDPATAAAPAIDPELPSELAPRPAAPRTLIDRLRRVRKLLAERAKAGNKGDHAMEYYQALSNGWMELHQATLKDPATYVAFLRAPGNEECCEGLLDVLSMAPSFGGYRFFMGEELPRPILDGVAELLASGTKDQQVAAARLVRDLTGGAPSEKRDFLLEPCLALLSSDDPRARAAALDVLRLRHPERLDDSLSIVADLWSRSQDGDVRSACLSALAQAQSPAGTQLFYEKMSESVREHVAESLPLIRARILRGNPDDADRCGNLLLAALRATSDANAYQSIAAAALDLPLAKATPILEQAGVSAPTTESRDRLRRILSEIQAGEVRSDRLRAMFLPSGVRPF